jgi:hypothetical protein
MSIRMLFRTQFFLLLLRPRLYDKQGRSLSTSGANRPLHACIDSHGFMPDLPNEACFRFEMFRVP